MTRIDGQTPGIRSGGLGGVSEPEPQPKPSQGPAPQETPPSGTEQPGTVGFTRSPRFVGSAPAGAVDYSRMSGNADVTPDAPVQRPLAEVLTERLGPVAELIKRETETGLPNSSPGTWSPVATTKLGAMLAEMLIGADGKIDRKALTELRAEIGRELARVTDGYVPTERTKLGDFLCRSNMELINRQLGRIEGNAKLAETLNGIGEPCKGSASMVRLALGLAPDAPLTAADGRKAALTALLSPFRQGSVGSCFGTSVALLIQAQRPDMMAADLKAMIEKGYLTRTQNGVDIPIPMSIKTAFAEFRQQIQLTDKNVPKGNLAQVPGVD